MFATADNPPLTKDAYLDLEQTSPERHEYVAGQVYAWLEAAKNMT